VSFYKGISVQKVVEDIHYRGLLVSRETPRHLTDKYFAQFLPSNTPCTLSSAVLYEVNWQICGTGRRSTSRWAGEQVKES